MVVKAKLLSFTLGKNENIRAEIGKVLPIDGN